MPLSRDFKETVKARAESDPAFRAALFREAINLLLEGEVEVGKSVLRDYINATIGFVALAEKTKMSSKSLMRMFSPQGNPRMDNLFNVIRHLQAETDVRLNVEDVA